MTFNKQTWACKKTQDNNSSWFASSYDMSGTTNGTVVKCKRFKQHGKPATTIVDTFIKPTPFEK